MLGFFSLDGLNGEPVPRDIGSNALTILYGIVRGILMSASGWLHRRSIQLPTVYFHEIMQDHEAAEFDVRLENMIADRPDPTSLRSRKPAKRTTSSTPNRKKKLVK